MRKEEMEKLLLLVMELGRRWWPEVVAGDGVGWALLEEMRKKKIKRRRKNERKEKKRKRKRKRKGEREIVIGIDGKGSR